DRLLRGGPPGLEGRTARGPRARVRQHRGWLRILDRGRPVHDRDRRLRRTRHRREAQAADVAFPLRRFADRAAARPRSWTGDNRWLWDGGPLVLAERRA